MGEIAEPIDTRTIAKVIAGFAVAGIVLYLFGRVIGWDEIFQTMRNADVRWLVVACLSTTIALVVWSKAWDIILAVVEIDIPLRSVVITYFAATFADYVTPFGRAGGGPLVAYILSRDERASFEDGLASIVTADSLNLLPFFSFAGIGFAALALGGRIPERIDDLILGLSILLLVVPGIGYVLWYERQFVDQILRAAVRPIADWTERISVTGIRERLEEFYRLLEEITDTGHALGHTLAYSYFGWIFFAAPLYFAGLTIGVRIDPLVVLFVVPASALASFVPTPGGLGGVEAAVTGLLIVLAGIPLASAISVALLYRIASYWYVILVGGVAALYEVYTH